MNSWWVIRILFCQIFLVGLSTCWTIQVNLGPPTSSSGDNATGTNGNQLNLIFPGTKWCGSGSTAQSPDDLGHFKDTDACCRDHDLCEDIIEARQTKHNLTNNSFHTRLHCSCDEKFYDCLHRSEDKAGWKIGTLYFDLLGTKCFRNDYPIVGCKRHTDYPRRCVEYQLDQSQPKIYQWFDVPLYQ